MRAPLLLMMMLTMMARPSSGATLQEELMTAAHADARLTVGIFVEHLERHEIAGVNRERPFTMMSTFKLPLAIVALRASELHELPPLDGNVKLLASDMLPGVSPLQHRFPSGGEVPLREVLAQMLEESDNSAQEALLRLLGGGAKVTAALRAMGLDGISIDRSEKQIAHDVGGATPAQKQLGLMRLLRDPRDHASPAAMGKLLEKLWRGELPLSPADAQLIRQEMARCHTGLRRLRAGLPPGATLADRTGTCDEANPDGSVCANDLGVLTLPSGEHVAIVVMIEDEGVPLVAKERAMQAAARKIWEHYAQ